MTNNEIKQKYRDLFILVMESAGEETGNRVYKEVEERLKRSSNLSAVLEDINAPFDFYATSLIMFLAIESIKESMGGSELWKQAINTEISEEAEKRTIYIYNNYLEKPTRRFCSKYGIQNLDVNRIRLRIIPI